MSIHSEVQKALVEEAPEIFAFYCPIPLAVSSRIQGVVSVPGNPYWNV